MCPMHRPGVPRLAVKMAVIVLLVRDAPGLMSGWPWSQLPQPQEHSGATAAHELMLDETARRDCMHLHVAGYDADSVSQTNSC